MTPTRFPSLSPHRALSRGAFCLFLLSACSADPAPAPEGFGSTSTNTATTTMLDGGGTSATTAGPVDTTGQPVATTLAATTGAAGTTTTGLPTTTTGEGVVTSGEVATTGDGAGLNGDLTTGDGGAATGDVDAGPAEVVDQGKGDGKDVVTIGDSWMNYFVTSGGIEGALDRAGTSYRHHGLAGTKLLNGQIPSQFDDAVRNNPDIKTVIFTGGGNDVLLEPSVDDCPDFGPKCQMQLERIDMATSVLLDTMASAGVRDVVYIGYAEGAGDAAAEATNVTKNGVGDMCAARTDLNCYPIDSTPIIMNGLSFDGIHPTPASSDKIVAVVLALMEEKGMRR